MTARYLSAALLLASLLGCSSEDSSDSPAPVADPPVKVLFTLNTHDWTHPDLSLDSIRTQIAVHEKYNIPLDVYFTDPAFQMVVASAPDLLAKLKSNPLFAVSYHLRPPTPYASGAADFVHLGTMSDTDAKATVVEYEEHRLDVEWGTTLPSEPGGYQFVKDTIGYAPVIVGSAAVRPDIVSTVYKDKGATFAVSHKGKITLGEKLYGLYLRPEDKELRWYDYLDSVQAGETTTSQIIGDAVGSSTSTFFLNIKLHENDYYARPAPFWAIYTGDPNPPFDISLAQGVELYTADRTAAMKSFYEEAVAYVAAHPEKYKPINAFDLQGLLSTAVTTTPVYVTLASHNERNLLRFGRFRDSFSEYVAYRNSVLKVAKLIHSYGLKYSWQSDYVILEAIGLHESTALQQDPDSSGGKPLLVYLAEDLGVSIEPHAHESENPEPKRFSAPPNYADLAYLIQANGNVTPAPIVGGTGPYERSVASLAAGIAGNVYAVTWYPEIVTAFAYAPNHTPGSDGTASGVWRPLELSQAGYTTHNPSGPIITIGRGDTHGEFSKLTKYLQGLISKIESGEAPSGRIYTASLIFAEDHMLDQNQYAEFEAILVELQSLADSLKIVPATHPEVVGIWKTDFGQAPNVYEMP